MTDLKNIKSLNDWRKFRDEIQSVVLDVLQEWPPEHAELQVKVLDEVQFAGYVRRRVNYFVDEWERVTAWMFVPEDRDEMPAILCCHQTVPQGKDEPAGLEGDPNLAFAQHYAELGYVTLAPDCITAGERVSVGLQPFDTANFYKDYPRMSAMGKMLWDHMHALDVLCDTRRVDSARIGVVGHSLGGYNALLLSAFDERVQACVASCAFTRFADDPEPERWARENWFVHLPKLRPAIKKRRFPFDWEHILALAAPIPLLLLTASNDDVFPHAESCQKASQTARTVYRLLGATEALECHTHDYGHQMTPETLARSDDWFERWL
ncbi:MAG: prolyl oligopeptidase family serine peptidase [Candidatus Hydrogenedentes bacterium]|nr:prolyl oligopeptidase family serine peptidase [Candidatus Hydrogenedentota bacterium]